MEAVLLVHLDIRRPAGVPWWSNEKREGLGGVCKEGRRVAWK